MNIAYLGLGGNEGKVEETLQATCRLINAQAGNIFNASSIYQTAAWGNQNQPPFLNMVIAIKTALSPLFLLETLLKIERIMGRVRDPSQRWQQRKMDIDILYYNDEIINTPQLTVPHPLISNRNFVLVPLCEIAPEFVNPFIGKNTKQMLAKCDDKLDVLSLSKLTDFAHLE